MASNDENSYRKILKHTSVFGGVQLFQILVNLVRGKFVAIFLGPEGMGVSAMFNSVSNTVTRFSSLGLNLAFTKETAANRENRDGLATIRQLSTILIQLTALLGACVCILFAPLLSDLSFGSYDYAWQFALLGVAVGFTVAAEGKMAMLQGLHRVRELSRTSLAGALTGLVAGVPLYYFFGTLGIVPAMIILAVTTFGFYSYGLRRCCPKSYVPFSRKLHMPIVRRMLAMGAILLATNLINAGCTYAINIFIRMQGQLADVGLFNGANSITMQYTGVVFTAMALDYFPRLSAAAGDNAAVRSIVNRQLEIVALMAAPLSILLVASAPLVIRVLLTSKFLPVTELMRWLGISILLKAIAYPLGYIAFAKDNKKLFFWLEAVACNALYLGLSLVFYNFFGLMGLGYAAVVEQGACVLLYLAVNCKAYGIYPTAGAAKQIVTAILLGAACFCASVFADGPLSYALMGTVFCLSAAYSFSVLKSLVKSRE